MKVLIVFLVAYLILGSVRAQDEDAEANDENDEAHNIEAAQNRVAAQIEGLLEHYKQEDPVGVPGAPIPDPMDVPDMAKSLGMANLNMLKVKAYGLSKFRISTVDVDFKKMKAKAGIQLDQMLVKGNYILSSFFSKANGPFTVILKKVYVRCSVTLGVERDGHLTTEHIDMDITFGEMAMDFQNLGFLGSVFQGIINSAPNLVFDAMKPFMLQEADKQMRGEINTRIEKFMGDRRMPNSITPLDSAIAGLRKMVREKGYDPYRLEDKNRTMGVFSVQLTNTWITGCSSFYRVGNVTAAMYNNTISMRMQLGTQQITGAGQWEVGFGLMTRVGHVQFTVQHIRATVEISQPLDTRKRPQINDLQFDMGNIQVRCDGAGTLDYAMEFVVNVLPNLLRYQIMDAIENPIKQRVQEKFNAIDVEQVLKVALEKYKKDGLNFIYEYKLDNLQFN
ncbi:PREDICTED: uncharacterized protein LOC108610464 isoform X1 [Drosophila arizonae]|uniref:Uncharacterized protein LOC108610464 isoform X1 n=1 Tax=Drosophila arizonae TaxID=7263 RepID=A0ABM1NSY6_DROAR|nr:PREDICTED: uncharacterized protein LOC108610464 isoform X1 [Drosophila arizonae]